MLSGPYDWAAISDLPLSALFSLITHAAEREREQLTWGLWASLYPEMYSRRVAAVSYADYRRQLIGAEGRPSDKSADEVEAEMAAIIARYESRRR